MVKDNFQRKPWIPSKPTSKGAKAFHEAVANTSWIKDIVSELVKIAKSHIKENDAVVDFGAGTGTSAILLQQQVKKNIRLWLVDNSPSWLANAYELLNNPPKIECYLLEKKGDRFAYLSEVLGEEVADHVISANTVHLIPNIEGTFRGISKALKENGTFIFQTGNFTRKNRPAGALVIDDTVKSVHDIAIEMVKTDDKYIEFREGLDEKIKIEEEQRQFVFPKLRPLETYTDALKKAGLECLSVQYIPVKIRYDDWLNFLRVKRLQAGILPEIGGKEPSKEEIEIRDDLITKSALKLFKDIEMNNPLATKEYFIIECAYVTAKKIKGEYMKRKTALVTGASKGIGKAIAMELARSNLDVAVHYNSNENDAIKTAEEIRSLGVDCIAVKADISKFEDCEKMIEAVSKRFGNLDVLVNNAGALADRTLKNMPKEQWELVINVNLNGIFNVTKNALAVFNDNGRIINISSIIGIDGNFGQTNYAASKAGIIGFTKSLAKELGKRKITVNAVAPGIVETNMTKGLSFFRKKMIIALTSLKRFGTPEDIAHLVAFLASDKSGYITGEVVRIDGGLSI